MSDQKFHRGDHVRVADDLGPTMSHFRAGCEAIVVGSYRDLYGGDHNTESFSLFIKGSGQSSWYYEDQLTLIAAAQHDLLELWEAERKADIALKSDIDWIFNHGAEVLERPAGASVAVLAKHLGCTNLWGSQGEGYVYHANMLATLEHAAPFLQARDRDGWLAYATRYREAQG